MKTEVILSREFANSKIRQLSKSGFLCATDLTSIYNAIRVGEGKSEKRLTHFFENETTIEFLDSLCNELNLQEKSKDLNSGFWSPTDLKVVKRGKNNKGTWLHPYLFVKYAMWLSPDFEAKMIIWITDYLLEYRNQSGDEYKRLCRTMDEKGLIDDPSTDYAKVARAIRASITGSTDKDCWNVATVADLQRRKDIENFLTQTVETGLVQSLADLLTLINKKITKQRLQ